MICVVLIQSFGSAAYWIEGIMWNKYHIKLWFKTLTTQKLRDAELRLCVLLLDFAVGVMALEIVSMYMCVCVCVPKTPKEICIVLIPSYTNSRVISGKLISMEYMSSIWAAEEHSFCRAEGSILDLKVFYEKFSLMVFCVYLVSEDRRLPAQRTTR